VIPAAPAVRAIQKYNRFSVVYLPDVGVGAEPLSLKSFSTFFSQAPMFF
jgi:hypothetical protein